MKKFSKAQRYMFFKASKERTADLLTKSAVVPAFIQFRLVFREHKYLPTSHAIANCIDSGHHQLKLLLKIQNQDLKIKNLKH
jgi:hypothetical protein